MKSYETPNQNNDQNIINNNEHKKDLNTEEVDVLENNVSEVVLDEEEFKKIEGTDGALHKIISEKIQGNDVSDIDSTINTKAANKEAEETRIAELKRLIEAAMEKGPDN